MTRVGIVGGGITGLTLTHYLAREGIDSRVFEATDRPGGVIHTTTEDGHVLEHGPQRFRLTDSMRSLIADLELDTDVITPRGDRPVYVYHDGTLKRFPLSISGFLTTDLVSWRAKLRVLAEPLTEPGRPNETVAEFFRRKFGPEAYDSVIRPLFGGMYGSNPAEMPARYSLGGLIGTEPPYGLLVSGLKHLLVTETPPPASFTTGLQSLPNAVFDRHQSRIELGTPVTGIHSENDEYAIHTSTTTTSVDHVVITTPASTASTLLSDVAPTSAQALSSLSYNPLAIVHLESECDITGYGYQVHPASRLSTLGVTWNASLFDRTGIYTCFLGGMDNPTVIDQSASALGELAAAEFETVTGCPATVLNVTRLPTGFPAYDHSWDALDRLDLPERVHLATNYVGRMGIPSRVRDARELAGALAPSVSG